MQRVRDTDHLLQAQEIARVGSWEWDLATNEVVWSDELYRIFGETPGTFAPSFDGYLERIHADDRARAEEEMRAAVESGGEFAFEHRIGRPGGDTGVLIARGVVPGDGGRLIGTCQDVTEQKHREALLERFIADAAHELRTPVAALLGLVELLTRRREELSDEQARDAYEALGRAGGTIDFLAHSLLDLARLQRGAVTVTLEPLPLRPLLEELTAELPPPDGVEIDVHAEGGALVLADRARLHQILANLVTNAYKYGGPAVRIEAGASGESVVVTVADDGPGVEEALVPELFEPFRRGEHGPAQAGHGLGLAIAQMLAEACGGRLWYEPGRPRGSRFCVELPTSG